MVVGFFHDHNFVVRSGKVYTTGTLNSLFWNRYLLYPTTRLIVCGREIISSGNNKLPLSSCDNVEFVFSPSLSNITSLLWGANSEIVKDLVEKVDVVVCRLPSEIGFAAVKEAKKLGKKVVCEVVACPFDALSYHGGKGAKLYSRVIKHRMKKWVAKCDGALYVTTEELQFRYPCPGISASASNVEIDNINYEALQFRQERFENRRENGLLKFGIIGTLKNNTKGIDIAIKAMANRTGSLHVIGAGDASRYELLAHEQNVSFHHDGFKSKKIDVLNWLNDIDIYLQPSFQEGLPRATIEAMSVGCPVLASDAGGLTELVRSEYVHRRGDIIKLQDDIGVIIDSYDIEKDTKRSLDMASEYLSLKLMKRRKDFYKKFISI